MMSGSSSKVRRLHLGCTLKLKLKCGVRFASRHLSHWKLDVLVETCRPSMHDRITKDFGQQAVVQSRGYLSGFVWLLRAF